MNVPSINWMIKRHQVLSSENVDQFYSANTVNIFY